MAVNTMRLVTVGTCLNMELLPNHVPHAYTTVDLTVQVKSSHGYWYFPTPGGH
jgi:hypothetical protein